MKQPTTQTRPTLDQQVSILKLISPHFKNTCINNDTAETFKKFTQLLQQYIGLGSPLNSTAKEISDTAEVILGKINEAPPRHSEKTTEEHLINLYTKTSFLLTYKTDQYNEIIEALEKVKLKTYQYM